MSFPLLVLDASAALALLFAEQEGPEVASLLREVVEGNGQIHVPSLFWYELGNGLLRAQRSQRIGAEAGERVDALFGRLPIVTDADWSAETRGRILTLAQTHALSFYDAAYLELSLRLSSRLKSFDRHLLALKGQVPLVL